MFPLERGNVSINWKKPFDISIAYAQVQGRWVTCRSPYTVLSGHTEKELLLATAGLRQRAKRDRVRADLSAERLAAHMSKTGVHEELLRQRWRDLEGKKVLSIIAGQSGHSQTLGGVVPLLSTEVEAAATAAKLAALSRELRNEVVKSSGRVKK